MDLCHDTVTAASSGQILMKCYLRAGETNKARQIADFAAETYSYDGLLAEAEFLEATGDYKGALDYYKKIEERYEMLGATVSFCERYKAKTGKRTLMRLKPVALIAHFRMG